MKKFATILFIIQAVCLTAIASGDLHNQIDWYNVVWDSPSKDHHGAMPLGNGDISVNAWVQESGDLVFYIGKTDSWGDNSRLLKIGKVRVSLSPDPFKDSEGFEQTLNLKEGTIEVRSRKNDPVNLKIWIDANHPVVHVTCESKEPITATAKIELWRTKPNELSGIECSDIYLDRNKPTKIHAPTIVEGDTVIKGLSNRIGWYHSNNKTVGPEISMKLQGLSDYEMVDPILHRTFGAVITCENAKRIDDVTLATSSSKVQRLSIYVLTEHPATPEKWLGSVNELIRSTERIAFDKRRKAHVKWWGQFWDRSWIYATEGTPSKDSGAFVVTRGYTLQRYINACAGRGAYPIKFNGSIFTVPHEGKPGDADYRRWGPGYWWMNTRLPYIGMCTSGDYDLMAPLFKMYADEVFELSKYRTRHYFGFDGAYYPECVYFWGAVFNESYGWQRFEDREDKLQDSRYHKWEWVCGPELVCLMLDYYEHTEDEAFLRDKIKPLAKETMLFFENFYETGQDGKLVMHPSQALETWWECTNPMPEIAGLRAMSRRLLELPKKMLTGKERKYWQIARKKLPEIPVGERKEIRMLLPAEKLANKRNSENPELYAVYPFRQIAVGKPDIELGRQALKHRFNRGNSGWRQDEIFMAYLGLGEEARDNLVKRARNKHKKSRFPAFWGPNSDWTPDQTHGGVIIKTFQSMLMQTDGKKIYLQPAWPKEWDVDFKLHAPYKTIIRGKIRNGKIENLHITPKHRKQDIEYVK